MYRTRGARGEAKPNRTLQESPATASLHSATPKKNVSCNFDFRAGFFLKKERTFFFGVLPSKYSGSVAGLNADSAKRKICFFWGNGFSLCLG
jgi:hypothetical protein